VRGIIIAPGAGFRPGDAPVALLPVGGKALIEYPLALLLAAGIGRVLVVAPAADAARYQARLGGGESAGAHLSYLIGPPACDAAVAIALGGEFVGRRQVAVARADSVSAGLRAQLRGATQHKGARVFVAAGGGDGEGHGDRDGDGDGGPSRQPRSLLSGGGGGGVDGDGDAAAGHGDAILAFYDHTAAARAHKIAAASPPLRRDKLHRAYQSAGKFRVEQLAPQVTVVRVACAESLAAARALAAAGSSP